jgi:hypothetical protein
VREHEVGIRRRDARLVGVDRELHGIHPVSI